MIQNLEGNYRPIDIDFSDDSHKIGSSTATGNDCGSQRTSSCVAGKVCRLTVQLKKETNIHGRKEYLLRMLMEVIESDCCVKVP
jgi:hypothetical protein